VGPEPGTGGPSVPAPWCIAATREPPGSGLSSAGASNPSEEADHRNRARWFLILDERLVDAFHDYFGRTVNIAARIAGYARRGEVLVSDDVVAASAETAGLTFASIGPVELNGLSEAISLSVAHRAA